MRFDIEVVTRTPGLVKSVREDEHSGNDQPKNRRFHLRPRSFSSLVAGTNRVATAADDIGGFGFALTVSAAVLASFFRLAMTAGMSTLLNFGHLVLRREDCAEILDVSEDTLNLEFW